MIKGKTKSGFEFELEEKRINNYELVEHLAVLDANPLELPKVVNLLLGEKQKNALMNHLRDEEGFISMEKVSEEFIEILNSGKEVKNS